MTLEERQAVERRLAELTKRDGGILTPEAVVKDATSKSSPLHIHIYKLNDREAAHQHRLDLARQLIRSVKINVTVDRRAISVVAYVHDPGQKEQGYVPTVSLVNERDRAMEAIQREFERVKGIIERSRSIAEVLGMDDELEELLASIVRAIERVRRVA